MRIASTPGLAISTLLLVTGCTTLPQPVVHQWLAVPAGPRSITIAPSQPNSMLANASGSTTVLMALKSAGYRLRPGATDARLLLVLTAAMAPRSVGSLVPVEPPEATAAPAWIMRPRGGLGALMGSDAIVRVTALLVDARSGTMLWRGTISAAGRSRKPLVDDLLARLLAEMPHG